jgi:hypothetical protein
MATITKAADGTTTRIEHAREITWPDGHVEYSRRDDRAFAALAVDAVHSNNRAGETYEGATARVVERTVITSPWRPVGTSR